MMKLNTGPKFFEKFSEFNEEPYMFNRKIINQNLYIIKKSDLMRRGKKEEAYLMRRGRRLQKIGTDEKRIVDDWLLREKKIGVEVGEKTMESLISSFGRARV